MADYVAAGHYQLIGMKIQDVFGNEREISIQMGNRESDVQQMDIKFLVYRFVMNESIHQNAITAKVHVIDGVGLFYNMPLRCEEILELEIEDWFGVRRREKFMIHTISNFQPASNKNNSMLEYTLELVSWGGWVASTHHIRRAYNDRISIMVQEIFEDYFKIGPRKPDRSNVQGTDKPLFYEDTEGIQQLVVPMYNGLETMNFFCRNAYGNRSSSFKFFERGDGFHFASNDYLMFESYQQVDGRGEGIPKFYFQNAPDVEPGQADLMKMQAILKYDISTPYNTLGHLVDGTYYKQMREVDVNQRAIDTTDFKWYDEYNNYYLFLKGGQDLVPSNTEEFVQTFFKQGKRFIAVKDYPSIGEPPAPMVRDQPFRNQSAMSSWAVEQHNAANAINVRIYGRADLQPGNQIEIELPKIQAAGSAPEIDTERSGYYMVETIISTFENDVFIQDIVLVRGGVIRK